MTSGRISCETAIRLRTGSEANGEDRLTYSYKKDILLGLKLKKKWNQVYREQNMNTTKRIGRRKDDL